jgi:UDP-glucose 4-epimerase
MAKVLITGGAGFIGRHCAREFLDAGWEVRLFDCVPVEEEDPLVKSGCSVQNGDVRDEQAVELAMEDCDAIVHLAAVVSVPQSMEDPDETMDINVRGTRNILNASQRLNLSHVIIASSAAVYGEHGTMPLDEAAKLEPFSPYGESKVHNEKDVVRARKEGLNAIALRFFNVYGPNQSNASGYASLIPLFVEKMIRGEQPQIHGDGLQSRDFIHVSDLANAIVKLSTLSECFPIPVANVATQTQTSVLDIFETINEHLTLTHHYDSVQPQFISPRAGDITHSCGSNARLKSTIDWLPNVDLNDGLRKLIDEGMRSSLQ